MKLIYVLAISFLVSLSTIGQTIKAPSEGKSLVYIMRSNDLGSGLNFRVYDNDRFLGALPSRAYFIYECEPGNHLFWAASENRDYIEATLEPNKTYVMDMRAKIGLVITAVGLEPYSPDNATHIKRIRKVLEKHISANVVDADKSKQKEDNISDAMDAYNRIKDKPSSKIKRLQPNMNFKL